MIVSFDTIIEYTCFMASYSPPYKITSETLRIISEISEILGELKSLRIVKPNPTLRRQNSILTIQGSLAIEGNSFSLDQVSAVLEGKRVLGKSKEIQEVKNAIECYSRLQKLDPFSSKSLLTAHKLLMKELMPNPGSYRTGSVGILKGSKVAHIAPKASNVPELMKQLFGYLKKSKDLALIKSCVFHYELEFIHPFQDGNGRMGRLWQTLILAHTHPVFEFIPVESQIHRHQADYYSVLEACDKKGDSTEFILWMLEIILQSLKEFLKTSIPEPVTFETRIKIAQAEFRRRSFTRSDYLKLLKTVSAPTASRDLTHAVKMKILKKTGDKRTTIYSFTG